MISLPLLVVLLTITTNLISTIGAPVINDLLWRIYTWLVPSPAASLVPRAAALRREVVALVVELKGTSVQNEFARWAKLQRALDGKKSELTTLNGKIATHRQTFDSRASSIRWALTTGLRIFLQLWFSRRPMFWIPEGWMPGIVEWGLAFPRAPRGSVSIQVWGFAVGQVVAALLGVAVWLWARLVIPWRVAGAQAQAQAQAPTPAPPAQAQTQTH